MLAQFQDYIGLEPSEAILSPIFWYSILLVILFCLIWWMIKKAKSDLVYVFKDEEGAVQITPNALRELVRKSCVSIPGVHSPSTQIF